VVGLVFFLGDVIERNRETTAIPTRKLGTQHGLVRAFGDGRHSRHLPLLCGGSSETILIAAEE